MRRRSFHLLVAAAILASTGCKGREDGDVGPPDTSSTLDTAMQRDAAGTGTDAEPADTSAEFGAPDAMSDFGVDAGPGAPADHVVATDFGESSAAFPPTVNKIGFNSFWNSANDDGDLEALLRRRQSKAPLHWH